jgi:cytochrome c553
MRFHVRLAGLLLLLAATATFAIDLVGPPAWAYPMLPAGLKPPFDDGVPRTRPGSSASYTVTQMNDVRAFVSPDWFPQEHAPMPPVVANGRAPTVFACAFCHRADGSGGPENANIAGLPAEYILQQLADYKSGARSTSVPKRGPGALMINLSKALTDEEAVAAARYFAHLKRKENVRVVETAVVPRIVPASWFLTASTNGETEPTGNRVLEVPEDVEQFEMRDTRARFIAYVPPGSIARGETLVRTGAGGKTMACTACHGSDLNGVGNIPPLAGRSPSYLVRQLVDFQHGTRSGPSAVLMKEPVARLTIDDMVAIAAYLASRKP